MPLFGPSFNGTKLKVCLKLCITRLQMLQKKKENQGVLARKEIAVLLGKNKEELARIRVEQIIRDDYIVEVLEILELYCTLLTSRFGLIEAVKECDPGLLESIQTIMWCAPRLQAEVNELKQIAHAFGVRYGKEFIRQAMNNLDESEEAKAGSGKVSQRVVHKLTDYTPKATLVDSYLVAIGAHHGVIYHPPVRLPEADLLGGIAVPSASAPSLLDRFPSAPSGVALGGGLPMPTDFPNGSDFPSAGGAGAGGGAGGGGGFDMLFPSPPGGAGAAGPALYPPQQAPDLSYLPPAASYPNPNQALPPPPAQPPAAAAGGGSMGSVPMAQPSVQHFQAKVPGGGGAFPAPGDAAPSYEQSESQNAFPAPPGNIGGIGGIGGIPAVGGGGGGGGVVGYDSWDTPSIGGASASVGHPPAGYNPAGPTYAPVGSVGPEATYDGYTGNGTGNGNASEPTYAEIPGGNLPASSGAPRGSMENATYGANTAAPDAGVPGVPGGASAPPDFDELARRFQNLRDKGGAN